jgi:hypothetical protein
MIEAAQRIIEKTARDWGMVWTTMGIPKNPN